ncbi:AGAP006498-PA-like protein [Anopheles sinensis]|uniref:AGAP006498-PA-like protein n=1 Tax=Anopheles sinensis TaxID=74873 RepID=A0A084WGG6_ANOSI|nr:AGAP006498-PA-like protein [Anopheles sinensis]
MRLLLLGTLLLGACVVSALQGPSSGSSLTIRNVLPAARLMFPLEISVPDLINGVLSAFRYFWTRFQWLFGISDTEIIGAKDPPTALLPVVTPSPALKAVPLAPDAVVCSPISTVSVEVDDPVRHPYLHKPKVIRRKRRKKRRRKRIEQAAIDWDMVALEAWTLL